MHLIPGDSGCEIDVFHDSNTPAEKGGRKGEEL